MNIYVGNLPYGLTEAEMRELFSQHGEVTSANIITDKYSGQSKGFGFVDVLSPCVTFNKLNTYDWFKSKIYDLQETNHDIHNLADAFQKGLEWEDKIPTGLFYSSQISNYVEQVNVLSNPFNKNRSKHLSEELFDLFR